MPNSFELYLMHVVDGTVWQCNDVHTEVHFFPWREIRTAEEASSFEWGDPFHHRMLLSSIMHEPKYKVPEPLLYCSYRKRAKRLQSYILSLRKLVVSFNCWVLPSLRQLEQFCKTCFPHFISEIEVENKVSKKYFKIQKK